MKDFRNENKNYTPFLIYFFSKFMHFRFKIQQKDIKSFLKTYSSIGFSFRGVYFSELFAPAPSLGRGMIFDNLEGKK